MSPRSLKSKFRSRIQPDIQTSDQDLPCYQLLSCLPAFNLLSSACFCYKKHDLDGWGDADVAVADDEDGLHQDDDPKLCFPRLTVVVEVVAVVVLLAL